MKSLLVLLVMTSTLSVFAETYQCGDHVVVTGEDTVMCDNQVMSYDSHNGVFKLDGIYFNFDVHFENNKIVSTPFLIDHGQTFDCK